MCFYRVLPLFSREQRRVDLWRHDRPPRLSGTQLCDSERASLLRPGTFKSETLVEPIASEAFEGLSRSIRKVAFGRGWECVSLKPGFVRLG